MSEFGHTPQIGWTAVGVTQADRPGLQGRQRAPHVHTGAGPPIAILAKAPLVATSDGGSSGDLWPSLSVYFSRRFGWEEA